MKTVIAALAAITLTACTTTAQTAKITPLPPPAGTNFITVTNFLTVTNFVTSTNVVTATNVVTSSVVVTNVVTLTPPSLLTKVLVSENPNGVEVYAVDLATAERIGIGPILPQLVKALKENGAPAATASAATASTAPAGTGGGTTASVPATPAPPPPQILQGPVHGTVIYKGQLYNGGNIPGGPEGYAIAAALRAQEEALRASQR
jgi:hypothetical protein